MIQALVAVGILCLIGGFASLADEGLRASGVFLYVLVSGIVSSLVFFALAMILSKLNYIIYYVENFKTLTDHKIASLIPKVTCSTCGNEFDGDMKSCPKCGKAR